MAISSLIAMGIGFNPGSTKYIPTLGYGIGIAVAAPEVIQGGGGGRRKFKSYDQRQRERQEQIDKDNKAKYGTLPKGLADALKTAPSPYKRLAPAKVKAYANAAQNDDEDAMNLIMSIL